MEIKTERQTTLPLYFIEHVMCIHFVICVNTVYFFFIPIFLLYLIILHVNIFRCRGNCTREFALYLRKKNKNKKNRKIFVLI